MLQGRITKGVGGLYIVDTEQGIYSCRARGIFYKEGITPLVGDNVDISIIDEKKQDGYVQRIHERKNILIRPKAANIDLAVVVFSALCPEINFYLLDSILISAERQGVNALLCINKTDLVSHEVFEEIKNVYALAGYKVIAVSAEKNTGLESVLSEMENKVSILAGPSGVGKSSIINALSPGLNLETGELSRKVERGKHTTRHAELIKLSENTFIVDSPGFSSLIADDIPPGELQKYFREFEEYRNRCYYGDCLHISEHDCMVKEQIGKAISAQRYNRYVDFVNGVAKNKLI